jgi:hypothetical protein
MRKKHGSVPKIHTCSGPDSHNEQKHWHSRCHYKRNSGSTSAGMNNLHTGEPAGRQVPGDSPTTSAAAAMVPGRMRPPEGSLRVPAQGMRTSHQSQRAGRSEAHRQVLAPTLATKARKRAECCILAGQQQFALPGMAGGRLLRRARGWSPPPEAGRRGGQPTRAGGRAPARLALRPSKDDEHP